MCRPPGRWLGREQFEPFEFPIRADGAVYVADYLNRVIRRIRDGQVMTLAGAGRDGSLRDGRGSDARFLGPLAITPGPRSGDLLVADGGCAIRRVTLAGEVTTLVDANGYPIPVASPSPASGGDREPGPDGACRYLAPADPFPLGRRTVRVRVAPRGRPELAVERELATSTGFAETLFNNIPHIREYLGVADLRQPRMALLAGSPTDLGEGAEEHGQGRFRSLSGLDHAWDHPDPDLVGKWLVMGDDGTLLAMDGQGAARPWCVPGALAGAVISVRRPGPGAGPWRAKLTDPTRKTILEVDGKGKASPCG